MAAQRGAERVAGTNAQQRPAPAPARRVDGEDGALRKYGTGRKADFDRKRV